MTPFGCEWTLPARCVSSGIISRKRLAERSVLVVPGRRLISSMIPSSSRRSPAYSFGCCSRPSWSRRESRSFRIPLIRISCPSFRTQERLNQGVHFPGSERSVLLKTSPEPDGKFRLIELCTEIRCVIEKRDLPVLLDRTEDPCP